MATEPKRYQRLRGELTWLLECQRDFANRLALQMPGDAIKIAADRRYTVQREFLAELRDLCEELEKSQKSS
jgi:hypothetical protein